MLLIVVNRSRTKVGIQSINKSTLFCSSVVQLFRNTLLSGWRYEPTKRLETIEYTTLILFYTPHSLIVSFPFLSIFPSYLSHSFPPPSLSLYLFSSSLSFSDSYKLFYISQLHYNLVLLLNILVSIYQFYIISLLISLHPTISLFLLSLPLLLSLSFSPSLSFLPIPLIYLFNNYSSSKRISTHAHGVNHVICKLPITFALGVEKSNYISESLGLSRRVTR